MPGTTLATTEPAVAPQATKLAEHKQTPSGHGVASNYASDVALGAAMRGSYLLVEQEFRRLLSLIHNLAQENGMIRGVLKGLTHEYDAMKDRLEGEIKRRTNDLDASKREKSDLERELNALKTSTALEVGKARTDAERCQLDVSHYQDLPLSFCVLKNFQLTRVEGEVCFVCSWYHSRFN